MRFAAVAFLVAVTASAQSAPKDDMMAADKAFSAMSVAQGEHKAFLAYMTEDVHLYQGAHPPLIGKAPIEAFFAAEEKADPDGKYERLEWTPLEAEASPDGILGYTRGTWVFSLNKPGSPVKKLTGYYVTEWRRQPDGTYKFCLDIGGADKH